MKIIIRSRDIVVDAVDYEYSMDRIESAIDRFSDELREVKVVFEDANGSRGGVDKVVKAICRLKTGVQLQASVVGSSIRSAVDELAHKLDRAISKRKSIANRNKFTVSYSGLLT